VLLALFVILLVVGFQGFKMLVKVGNIKYLYNYQHDTKGSLPVEQNLEYEANPNVATASAIDSTKPSNWNISTKIQVDRMDVSSYTRTSPIFFTSEYLKDFTDTKGILTFRGDYMRNLQAYGTATILEEKFSDDSWSFSTGKVLKSNGVDYWSGNGWTGQPLVVQWDEETKRVMNLYATAKNKVDLVEVIYPGMDGFIHFLDMETGEPTRDAINVGMTFKGTASIHPGGIPMIVLGSGDAQTGMFGECVSPRIYIYSLIDGEKLYEFAANDEMAPRVWHAFDSSAIFHAKTDTLISIGENGVIYTLKLNTSYDKAKGTLSIAPSEEVKVVYSAERNSEDGYLWGSESSASVWKNYLFLGDNGGIVYCIDLNTMQMVWTQDVYDDVNSSVIFEEDEFGNKYLYVATTLKYATNDQKHNMGEANVFKLDAMTGEIIWRKPYEVHTVKGLAGGFLATGISGKGSVKDYVYYFVSKTPDLEGGYLVALSKETGEEVWRIDPGTDSWSSANMLYTKEGQAYIVQGGSNGNLMLINANNGEILDRVYLGGGGIEATCAVFNNQIVVGTRNEKIVGVTVK
jgi:outer membrane protein assembly factor BamB